MRATRRSRGVCDTQHTHRIDIPGLWLKGWDIFGGQPANGKVIIEVLFITQCTRCVRCIAVVVVVVLFAPPDATAQRSLCAGATSRSLRCAQMMVASYGREIGSPTCVSRAPLHWQPQGGMGNRCKNEPRNSGGHRMRRTSQPSHN